MDLRQCLENLRRDIGNGGPEDDSFATNCYIIMANQARRLLRSAVDTQELNDAREYLATCSNSGCDGLVAVAVG